MSVYKSFIHFSLFIKISYEYNRTRNREKCANKNKSFCDNNNFKLDQFRTITALVIISIAAINLVNGFSNRRDAANCRALLLGYLSRYSTDIIGNFTSAKHWLLSVIFFHLVILKGPAIRIFLGLFTSLELKLYAFV